MSCGSGNGSREGAVGQGLLEVVGLLELLGGGAEVLAIVLEVLVVGPGLLLGALGDWTNRSLPDEATETPSSP